MKAQIDSLQQNADTVKLPRLLLLLLTINKRLIAYNTNTELDAHNVEQRLALINCQMQLSFCFAVFQAVCLWLCDDVCHEYVKISHKSFRHQTTSS